MTPWRIFQPAWDEHDVPVRVMVAFLALCFAFTASVAALGFGIVSNRNRIDDISRVRDAVCNLRADQIRRIAATERFLEDHPEGFSGIDPQLLRNDLRDRKQVVDALAPLDCD